MACNVRTKWFNHGQNIHYLFELKVVFESMVIKCKSYYNTIMNLNPSFFIVSFQHLNLLNFVFLSIDMDVNTSFVQICDLSLGCSK